MGFWKWLSGGVSKSAGRQNKKLSTPVEVTSEHAKILASPRTSIQATPHESILPHEFESFKKEVEKSGTLDQKTDISSVLPTHVSVFDDLIKNHGFERSNTILLSGGAGCGKTTFAIQSLYNGALNGEKGIYISLEEDLEKLRSHMKNNYGWDLKAMENKGLLCLLKVDSTELARTIEAMLLKQKGELRVDLDMIRFPFVPDRIVFDSLSALGMAFGNAENYRRFIQFLFEHWSQMNAVTFMVEETEQAPQVYSHAGVEEFLADGLVVFYNLKAGSARQQAMEILKLRSSKHAKKIIPFSMESQGIEIFPEQEVFSLKDLR